MIGIDTTLTVLLSTMFIVMIICTIIAIAQQKVINKKTNDYIIPINNIVENKNHQIQSLICGKIKESDAEFLKIKNSYDRSI